MKRLKICYLADWKSTHTQRWLSYFVHKGHQVHLLSDHPRPRKTLEGVALHNFFIRDKESVGRVNWEILLYKMGLKLKWLLREIRPDILHAHYVKHYGWWGARSGFHPFVLTVWGSDIYIDPNRSDMDKTQVRFALKNADLITSDSEDLRKTTISLGASSSNNYIIQFGIDLSKFNTRVDGNSIRKDLRLDGAPIVLSTRSFKPVYNIDIIIQAIPFVLREIPKVRFILKKYEGNQETKLRDLVRKLGVGEAVKFVDTVDYSEMPKYYSISDIFVSIPTSDATSVSLLEAMACGVAPIVTDLPSMREWIKNGKNGYIVPIRNAKILADTIIRLLKNNEVRQEFVRRNRALVKEKADYCKHMQRMEELYYKLI